MDDYRIETPEQVELSYTVAGLGTRFMALFIDTLIQCAVVVILFLSLATLWDWNASFAEWYIGIIILVYFIIFYGYFLIFELAMKGRTPGKAAMKLRVVRQDGRAADLSGLVLRNLLRIIDFLPAMYTAGIICMFASKNSRRLGDLAGGTVVVVEGKKASLDSVLAEQAAPAHQGLTNQEYDIIKDFWARRQTMNQEARYRIAFDIALPLYDRFGVPPAQRADPERFLYSLLRPNPGGRR